MPADSKKPEVNISPATLVIGLAVALILGAFGWLTFGPKPTGPPPAVLTEEAKGYLDSLALSEVHVQAAESYVQGQLVEILGNIGNNGAKAIKLIEVVCVFRDVYGNEAKRERAFIAGGRTGSLPAGKTKPFRMAFEGLPASWNQGIPNLVIAQIVFE